MAKVTSLKLITGTIQVTTTATVIIASLVKHLQRPLDGIHALLTACRDFSSASFHLLYRGQESDSSERKENCPKSPTGLLQVAHRTTLGGATHRHVDVRV